MSEMEWNKGRLIPFNITEDIAKALVIAKEGEDSLDDCYETYLEQLSDDYTWYDDTLAKVGGGWYKVEFEIEGVELDGFAEASVNRDGSIDFNTCHYNRGGHWAEVVERALENGGTWK